jgi:hypothetical protein
VEKETAFVKLAEKTKNIKKPENTKKIETKISLASHSINNPTVRTNSKMRLHPSALLDNEEYTIEIKNTSNDVKHVYKGKRKITSEDKINEEGVYHSLWFVDLTIIYINENITLKPPKLKRCRNISNNDLSSSLLCQNGREFELTEVVEDNEEITFYDSEYYEKCVLPKLVTENMNNKLTNDYEELSCV